MPLYEYQCEACEHVFEKIQKFSDPLEEICPKCGGRVQKLVSSPAIQFKGSGWYITDYAKKSSTDTGSTKTGSASSTDKGSSSDKTEKSDSSSSSSATASTDSAKKD